jgi:peptide/nickel transport system permease protein
VRPNSFIDYICGATAYLGLSIPSVFLALLAVLFAYYTGWFPVGGMRDLVNWEAMTTGEKALDLAHHLALPASVIGFHGLAGYMRQMRGQMVETMSADYVRTARAKGLSRKSVVYKHALRNAINPLLTLLGFSLAGLLSGSFLVEVVMNWPGLARVVVDAVFARDEPLVMAAVLVATLMLIAGNIIADILLAMADPRIRLE